MIGNSLTEQNDLPRMLCRLADATRVSLHCEAVILSGAALSDHWIDGHAAQRIAAGSWTIVVLQQGPSGTTGRPSLLEYATRYSRLIRGHGARPAMYMVWPSRQRSYDFDRVSDSYHAAALKNDALLLPVGEAWRAAWRRDQDIRLYAPDNFHPTPAASYLAALVFYHQLFGALPESTGEMTFAKSIAGDGLDVTRRQLGLLREAAIEACQK